MVEADPDRLAQVIGNLIDNGLKFAESSVKVDVAPNGPSASVTVTDDGPGVADEDVPHIFDRLYSGQSQPERAESSIGLGLTIVRELLAAMGGRIEVENITPTGSRFRLDLPLISGAAQDRDP
jgi:signal transduction histidine kinase